MNCFPNTIEIDAVISMDQNVSHPDYFTDSTIVAGSEVSSTNINWTRQRSGAITLTTGKEYVVRLKSSGAGPRPQILNARIILDQSDAGGITDVEVIHQQVNRLSTDSDTGYTSQSFINYYK